jgi:hypothetical protein
MTQTVPQIASKAKVIILTGQWGGGKTVTALSYVPPTWKGQEEIVKRILIDPEMRASSHESPDGKDYPEAEMYGFKNICEGRFDPSRFVALMKAAHSKNWANGTPDVIIIDDAGIWQDVMFTYWGDKTKAVEAAKIYGLDTRLGQLNQKSWRPSDPGVISLVFKRLFEEFVLDLREQNISLIITAPLHNIWQNFGSREYDEKGQPKMKIVAKSAKVLDIFVKHADVIWMLERLNQETRKMSQVPTVIMDPWNPKQSFPGIPEKFEWPGWSKIWTWHRERKHMADVSKLFVPQPEFDQETMDEAARVKKVKLYKELEGVATIEEINAILTDVDAPKYTVETHDQIVEYIKRYKQEVPAL